MSKRKRHAHANNEWSHWQEDDFKNTEVKEDEIKDTKILFDFDIMGEVCTQPEEWFGNLPEYFKLPAPEIVDCGFGRHYWYFDMGKKVLAVAHLDSVANMGHFEVVDFSGKRRVYSANLDDRLGAYVILSLLRKYGMEYDILLTTGEESGQSTAKQFNKDYADKKKYNWIFEFDRTGTDAVLYQYEDKKTKKLVERYGWKVGMGSFTDIRELEDFRVKAFNFGVGYHDYHDRYAYAQLGETAWSVRNFMRFYRDLRKTKLTHEPKPVHVYRTKYRPTYTDGMVWDMKLKEWGWPNSFPNGDTKGQLAFPDVQSAPPATTPCDIFGCTREVCKGQMQCIGCEEFYHGDTELESNGQWCTSCFTAEIGPCRVCKILTYMLKWHEGVYIHVCTKCRVLVKAQESIEGVQ